MNWHLGGHSHRPRPHGPVPLERVVASAPFPIYGVVENPRDLSLRGFSYCGSARDRLGQPKSILQVMLSFGYPPAALRPGFQLELTTTDPNHLADFGMPPNGMQFPTDGDVYDTDGRLYSRYSSVEEATVAAAPARSSVIEHFPIAGEIVVAVLRHWTRPNPEWLFTLTRPGLRLDGRAWEYTQSELFKLLGHVQAVSDQPQIVAQYQLELAAWARYFGFRSDSA
jgi:hypothetical protein